MTPMTLRKKLRLVFWKRNPGQVTRERCITGYLSCLRCVELLCYADCLLASGTVDVDDLTCVQASAVLTPLESKSTKTVKPAGRGAGRGGNQPVRIVHRYVHRACTVPAVVDPFAASTLSS